MDPIDPTVIPPPVTLSLDTPTTDPNITIPIDITLEETPRPPPEPVLVDPQPPEPQEAPAPDPPVDTQEEPSTESNPPEPENTQENTQENAEENPERNNEANAEEDAFWIDSEEDTSVPDEAEMKEIESQAEGDYSALEYNYWEKNFHPDLDDPEYRPIEKARLTWKINGVRGTKEQPNHIKIMRSPPAYIGGYWWTIKFFPRGNNVGSLSIYIECSPTMPKVDNTFPETEFKVLRGPADTVLDTNPPEIDFKFARTEDSQAWMENFKSQYPAAANQAESAASESWRVSAQIGVILYNPEEPRTGWMQSSCHQFNSHNLDWGWTNFHGPWDQIHRRQRGQRQALLRHDSLAFDAYIRIFDDPTRSLWWHPSDSEPTWDSLSLTGYRPLGDSVINHSAEVAGLATWMHIAPFCNIIQKVNVLEHLTNCDVKPKPLCDALQTFLWQLRSRGQSLQYVDTDPITSTLRNLHEYSSDVCEFWERLRRTLELELAGTEAVKELAQLFDSPSIGTTLPDAINTVPTDSNSPICIPADQVQSTAEAFRHYLGAKPGRWVLPPILHLELGRQKLDKAARQWRLLYNRVDLDEELDLSPFLLDGQHGKYVLYGYIVHRGRRTSGKFFSILRPGGPGTKWLAFDDGSDNRVECLTRKTALGPHLGLDSSQKADHKTGHDVAIAVMYIRSDVVNDFLPGPQGPWDVSEDLKEYYENGAISRPKKSSNNNKTVEEEEDIQVEVYSLQKYDELGSLFDTYDLMSQAKAAKSVMYLTVPRSTNLIDLRKRITTWASTRTDKEISPEHVRLWQIGHTRDRFGPTLAFARVSDLTTTLDQPLESVRYWMQIVSDVDAKYFAMKDPHFPVTVNAKSEEAVIEHHGSESSDEGQPAPETGFAQPSSSANASRSHSHEESTETPPQPAPQLVMEAVNNETTENPTTPAASEEPAQNATSSDSVPPEGSSNENDAVIAAIIAHDLEQLDESQPSATNPEQDTGAAPTPEGETPEQPVDDAQPPTTPEEPEVILPVEHVYYYIQLFDMEAQVLRTVGSFFSQKEEQIKAAIKKHLEWPATKDFQIWQRVDGTTVTTIASAETFEMFVPDGTCFIVGDKLNKDKRARLNEAGSFANPDQLVRYLWAESRRHPTRAFTGTKTIDATFTSEFYSGEFMKGYFHGKGKHISDSAATYDGDFVLGKRHGKGMMEYPTGDTYDGDWFENQCHGQGTFVECKTGNKYVGGYKDGKRHGRGISYWEVADEEMDLCQICFGEEQDALFYDCGHVCACVACARQVDICPICRKNILNVVKIYRT
ncbi:hypothetical protein P175DRAFT_0493499 [Aspergillus ochraceoroseus IBT 24754]|uniref:MATH and UCH domain protein n=2 Tax=Aspergillus ochraceoroseus TaxID=138278 RepID=A0A2T5LY47_9EURO|nr:uncharacterized protein P175DRAFT_0493499 [Aspergillus ochraceoroseus IBT 24754]KKK17094.1 MATH and UCH domain protein [Aspergillus ochraceoroseus]PTU21218.1 hypothetical protein P175DRAFT_0493499 [Aspergillus ochraceoroseus IBT 24754]